MRITKIIIENFKTYKYQEFDIEDKDLILLTGPNGFGKTTIIDSIEWCLTGDISRLKKSYEERNTTQIEKGRSENYKGILKHSGSNPNDKIRVTLYIKINETRTKVYREQVEDNLYIETNLIFEENISKDIENKISEYVGEGKFYNYHVCDTHKVFNFLNDSRQDIKRQFNNFIQQYPTANNVSRKLLELIDELKIREEDYSNKKISEEIINKQKQDLRILKENIKTLEYPKIKLFEDDDIQIEEKDTQELMEQLSRIKNYGYNVVSTKIKDSIDLYKMENKISKLIEMVHFIESDNQNSLSYTIDNSFYKSEELELVREKLRNLDIEKSKIESSKTLEEIKQALVSEIYADIIGTLSTEIQELTESDKDLKDHSIEISKKEKGNEIITALSNLVVGREGLMNYKNEGNEKCPLCGSNETFNSITNYEEIASEARDYIERSETDLLNQKQENQKKLEIFNTRVRKLKENILKFIFAEIDKNTNFETSFAKHYNQTKEFFDKLRLVDVPIDSKLATNVIQKKTEQEKIIATRRVAHEETLAQVKNILITLNYKNELDEPWSLNILEKINLDIKPFITKEVDVSNFDFDIFNVKKLFIENLINNNKITEEEAKLLESEKINFDLDRNLERNKRYKNKAEILRNEIERQKTNLEKLELEEVGKYLYKIFTKVIKHTKISEFRLKRDGARINTGGATFLDQEGNNIHNIMSQGQLGVFILSYFFANMFKRKEETMFRTYFIDDITSSMDDMNVLSFVDIIKYQLSKQDGVIDQIFFSTCDSNLEKLLIHKMKSFGIDWANIKFTSYAKGTVTDNIKQVTF